VLLISSRINDIDQHSDAHSNTIGHVKRPIQTDWNIHLLFLTRKLVGKGERVVSKLAMNNLATVQLEMNNRSKS
jgi:hypothetical protein